MANTPNSWMNDAKRDEGLRRDRECDDLFHDWLDRAYGPEKDNWTYWDCRRAVEEYLSRNDKCKEGHSSGLR